MPKYTVHTSPSEKVFYYLLGNKTFILQIGMYPKELLISPQHYFSILSLPNVYVNRIIGQRGYGHNFKLAYTSNQ